jgi:hypothetical protein
MRSHIFTACLIGAALSACGSISGADIERNEAIELANRHFSSVLPQVPLERMTVTAVDQNSAWLVSYAPPDGSTGDTLTVEVGKNGDIVRGLRDPRH